MGYDYLALKALTARGKISSIGNQIGNNFNSNNIGEYFYNNRIVDGFEDNEISDDFQNNDIQTTSVYQFYYRVTY